MRMNRPKILAIDFDGTLCYNAWPDIHLAKTAWIHKLILSYVKYKQRKGWLVLLLTMREDKPIKDKNYLQQAVNWCYWNGLRPDIVNENHPEDTEKHGESRKIYFDLCIDDHNIGLIGWLLRRYE